MKLRDLLQKKEFRYALAGFACSVVAYGSWKIGVPVYREFNSSFAAKEFRKHGVWGTYRHHFFDTLSRLDEIRAIDEENEQLNQRVAVLEKQIELEHASHAEAEAKEATTKTAHVLKGTTGSELARELKTIDYEVPRNLLPHQIYPLALGYFRKGEYEQAAVLFSHLVEVKGEGGYQKPENFLMCGVSWFKLKHYKLSGEFLEKAKQTSKPEQSVHRKAILWQSFVAQAVGKKHEAQNILTSMIAKFPHSEEVDWVNRKPARQEREAHFSTQRKQDAEEKEEHHSAKDKTSLGHKGGDVHHDHASEHSAKGKDHHEE